MAATLTKIRGFVQTYSETDFPSNPATGREDLKYNIEEMLQILLWEINDDFNNISDDVGKHGYIHNLVSQVTYIADGITGFDKEENGVGLNSDFKKWLLARLAEFLVHVNSYFTAYFDFDKELPSHFLEVYRTANQITGEELQQKLTDHQVEAGLAKLIILFSEASKKSERLRVKTWRQWDYRLKTINEINCFLDNLTVGDATLGLLKLLVSREFNSIQVYGYFVKYVEQITLSEKTFPEQQQELLFLLKTFRQVRVEAQYFFNPKAHSLKASVLESLEAELSYLERKEKLFLESFKATNPESPSKFYFKVAITLAELMFFFRVMLEVGVISTKFNSYLYEFIANHIKTERADNISKKSMRNHFNNKPFPDRVVQNVKAWLEKINAHIDLYYKI